MSSDLKLKFSQQFDAPIWEVKSSGEYLLVNTRDPESLESKFSLANVIKAEMEWTGLQFEGEWWVSIYHLMEGLAIFQKFEDTQNIDSRSVFGYDLFKQEALWALEDVQLLGVEGSALKIKAEDQDDVLLLNAWTGEWVTESVAESSDKETLYPIHYQEDNEHFETLARFLKLKLDIELVGSCDYLEAQGLIFIAANHVNAGKKSLTLCVFDDAGNLLLKESLESDVKGLVSGAFFIEREALIFVTGKNELKIYNINEKI